MKLIEIIVTTLGGMTLSHWQICFDLRLTGSTQEPVVQQYINVYDSILSKIKIMAII